MSESQKKPLKAMRLGGIRSRVSFKVGISEAVATLEGVIKDMTSAGITVVAKDTNKEYLVPVDAVKFLDPPTEIAAEPVEPEVAQEAAPQEAQPKAKDEKPKSKREQALDKWSRQNPAAKQR